MDTETRAYQPRPRRHLTRMLLGCTALTAMSVAALAQDDADPLADEAMAVEVPEGTFRLSPILVNANAPADDDARSIVARELWVGGKVATSVLDTPASVSVITQREIRDRNATTVEEVLQYTPSIVTDYYGTDDRNDYYLVRGFQASTYRDGLTLGTMRGVREEPYAYERVEVLKGANSTLFGPSDPGGSVNFVSKMPRFERFGEAYAKGGSFDHAEFGFDFGDTLNAEGSVAYRLTGQVRDAEREYDYSRDDQNFFMGGVTWAPTGDTRFSLVYDYLEQDSTPNSGGYPMDREYSRSRFFGEPDFNYHDVERHTITAMLSHEFGNGLSLQSHLRYSDLEDDFGYIYLYDYAGRTGTMLDRFYFGSDSTAEELIGNVVLKYDTRFGTVDSSTVVGAEFRDASTTASSFYGAAAPIDIADPVFSGAPTGISPYSERDNDHETKSVFIQQNLLFADRVILTVGARHDWLDLASKGHDYGVAYDDSDDFSESSLRGALTYKVTDQVSAYASYVESVAPPSIGVEPERGEQYEIGVKYEPAGLNAIITAAVYDLTRNDITVPVVMDNGVIERQLIGETNVRGFEIEGKAEVYENFTLIGGYSYMDSEIVRSAPIRGADVEGNEFASTPQHMASLWGTYTLPGAGARGDMTFGVGARYVGSYYFTDANNNGRSEATTLVDAAFTYAVTEKAGLAVNVSNLFDNQHVVGSGTADYYNPGRTITAALRYTW